MIIIKLSFYYLSTQLYIYIVRYKIGKIFNHFFLSLSQSHQTKNKKLLGIYFRSFQLEGVNIL